MFMPSLRPPLSVLVVDAYHDAADSMVDLLMLCGYAAAAAYTPLGAILGVAHADPDVVIVDVDLAAGDRTLAEWIHARRFHRRPTLIAAGPPTSSGEQSQYLAEGFETYLPKPLEWSAVADALTGVRREAASDLSVR